MTKFPFRLRLAFVQTQARKCRPAIPAARTFYAAHPGFVRGRTRAAKKYTRALLRTSQLVGVTGDRRLSSQRDFLSG